MSQVPSIPAPSSFRGLIGVAREDITAPVGIYARSWGAAKHDVAEGLHRSLTLTCLTFQAAGDERPLVLIAADLGWWRSREDEPLMIAAVAGVIRVALAKKRLTVGGRWGLR